MEEVEVKTNAMLGFYGCNLLERYAKVSEGVGKKLVVNMENTLVVTSTGIAVLMRAANNNPHIEFKNVDPEIQEEMARIGKEIKEAENDTTGS
jgi:hypothetical protein